MRVAKLQHDNFQQELGRLIEKVSLESFLWDARFMTIRNPPSPAPDRSE